MNHLLLDLAKIHVANQRIPYHRARVGLMVTLKQAKHLTTPEEPHSVYVLPEKKAANSIVQAAAEILQMRGNARIVIVSPRKKLPAQITELIQHFPQAQILLSKKIGKKVRRFLKNKNAKTTYQQQQDEQNIIQQAAQNVQAALKQTLPENADAACDEGEAQIIHETLGKHPHNTVFTLLDENNSDENNSDENSDDQELVAAMRMLKKNRPKKKTDLVRLLSDNAHSNPQQAHDLVVKLQSEGIIKIDAAENVRYN